MGTYRNYIKAARYNRSYICIGLIGFIVIIQSLNDWGGFFPDYLSIYVLCLLGFLFCLPLTGKRSFSFSWFDAGVLILFASGFFAACKYGTLSEFCLYLLFYMTLRLISSNTSSSKAILILIGVFSCLQSVIAVLQIFHCLPSRNSLFTATGSYPNPALLGGCLACGFTATWIYLTTYHPKGVFKYWGWSLLFLQAAVLLLSNSRAAWFSSMLACLLFYLNHHPWKRLYKTCIVSIFVITFFIGSLYIYKPTSAQGRLKIWSVAIEMIQENPFVGSGWGTFSEHYMESQANYVSLNPNKDFSQFTANNRYAFSEPLRLFCEAGLMGFLIACTLISVLVRKRKGTILFPILLAWIIFSCFSYPADDFSMSAILCVVVGCLAPSKQINSNRPLLSRTILLVAGIGLLICSTITFIPRHQAEQALNAYFCGSNDYTVEEINKIYPRIKHVRKFVYRYARTLFLAEDYEHCIPILKQAILLYPSTDKYLDLGECCLQIGDVGQAERCYKEASRLLPSLVEPHFRLLILYEQNGVKENADKEAIHILSANPKIENETLLRYKQYAKRFLEKQ